MKSRVIYIWSDGTWCEKDEASQYTHMSDDYEVHHVPEDFTDDECDALAQERMG